LSLYGGPTVPHTPEGHVRLPVAEKKLKSDFQSDCSHIGLHAIVTLLYWTLQSTLRYTWHCILALIEATVR